MANKVSIIIPLYNREKLIVETLDSVLKQEDYSNWECIIVDDHSEDGSYKSAADFAENDQRIKVYIRPENLPKGANSCRNFGFQQSTGDFIIWFDSDDLMTPDHLVEKVKMIEEKDLDFIVAKTQNFKEGNKLEPYKYYKPDYGITASDFILLKIHWYTYDVILKRKIAEKISWNQQMKSWQDYNYFCKMLLETVNGDFLDKVLTYRRIHENSIQKRMTNSKSEFDKELLNNRLLTYADIHDRIDEKTKSELIYGMMNLAFEVAKTKSFSQDVAEVKNLVARELGSTSHFFFKIALKLVRFSGKGYYFLEKAKMRTV